MQTQLADFIRDTAQGQTAESILRKCVHCGFCAATCPTYQLLGNELDSPRGRIYLIKQMLEGTAPTARTQLHLDRCLTCRSCETTCPSGVNYGQLLDIGRELVDEKVVRTRRDRLFRRAFTVVVPRRNLVSAMLGMARLVAFALPKKLARKIPAREKSENWPDNQHSRKMIIHQGCIQKSVKPAINAAAARLLDQHSITAIRTADACCGALGLHLGDRDYLVRNARKNIDAWMPHIEAGAEAIISTASGCGVTIKDYGQLLADDIEYSERAEKVASLAIDISEVDLSTPPTENTGNSQLVAFHSPCSLQHGQKIVNSVEKILVQHGFRLTHVENSHLCCGSAGVYSMLMPDIADRLLENKVEALERGVPEVIVTANIGCLMHLNTRSSVPVKHWIELVAPPAGQ